MEPTLCCETLSDWRTPAWLLLQNSEWLTRQMVGGLCWKNFGHNWTRNSSFSQWGLDWPKWTSPWEEALIPFREMKSNTFKTAQHSSVEANKFQTAASCRNPSSGDDGINWDGTGAKTVMWAKQCLATKTQQQVLLCYWSCSHTVSAENPSGVMLAFMGNHLFYHWTQECTSRKGHMGSGQAAYAV